MLIADQHWSNDTGEYKGYDVFCMQALHSCADVKRESLWQEKKPISVRGLSTTNNSPLPASLKHHQPISPVCHCHTPVQLIALFKSPDILSQSLASASSLRPPSSTSSSDSNFRNQEVASHLSIHARDIGRLHNVKSEQRIGYSLVAHWFFIHSLPGPHCVFSP